MRILPRASAVAANSAMASQVKDEEKSLGTLIAAAIGGIHPPSSMPSNPSKRPARAAAVAANAGITRQVAEEENSFLGFCTAKKRPSATSATATIAKKSRVSTTKSLKVEPSSLTITGKKRGQAAEYETVQAVEAAPVITDLPLLPFSSSANLKFQVKSEETRTTKPKAKAETKVKHSLQQIGAEDGRSCEFCRKVANICVLMHCTACRRVYHAKCFVNTFKPCVDVNTPILDQIERLRLDAPERRGNIFRCASCKAAFVDFNESGGYLWECDCPTCSQPDKLVSYRQHKLVQMINDAELEKQRKQAQKSQAPKAKKSGKPLVSMTSSAAPDEQDSEILTKRQSTLRSRGGAPERQESTMESGADTTEAIEIVNDGSEKEVPATEKANKPDTMDVGVLQKALEGVAEQDVAAQDQQANVVQNSAPPQNDEPQQTEDELESQQKVKDKDEMAKEAEPKNLSHKVEPGEQQQEQPSPEPLNHQDTLVVIPPKQENPAPRMNYNPVGELEQPKLSGDELVRAVQVKRDDKSNGWCFPLMCSRTSSLRESGVMKSGKCMWSPKKMANIQCGCCNKLLNYSEFVHHTDNSLVKNVKSASEDPTPYLFVEHRDIMQHTPLDQFLPVLRSWVARHSLNNTPNKSRRSHSLAVVVAPTASVTNPEPVTKEAEYLLRLRSLALFERPKHRGSKTSIVARLADTANLNCLAQVVCLSPKYVGKMADGSLADRVVRSQTSLPYDAFPRKTGWLAFNSEPLTARLITCKCCGQRFNFDHFAEHAGIVLSELKQRSRQFLFVVERQDESVLMPFNTFVRDLETAMKDNALDLFLDELPAPPSCIQSS